MGWEEGEAGGDALEDGGDGFEGRAALAHELDGEEGAGDADDEFAVACGGGGAGGLVDVEACADDGGIANAAGHFEGEA